MKILLKFYLIIVEIIREINNEFSFILFYFILFLLYILIKYYSITSHN